MATPSEEYPPPITDRQTHFLLSEIKDWSILNGLAVRPSQSFVPKEVDPSRSLAVTAPVTVFPSPFPRQCFVEACEIQQAYNQLYAAVAADEKWLSEIVEELIDVDDFIKNLWDVHLAVKEEGYAQENVSLGIFRSDYMIHLDPSRSDSLPRLRQVEFNTIASSFGGLAGKVSALHRHLLSTKAYPESGILDVPSSLPENPSISSISKALSLSHKAYGESKSAVPLPLCVIFVVQDPENNVFDQLAISSRLLSEHGIASFRLAFGDTLVYTSIESENPARPLRYTPPHLPSSTFEVTTLYFRAGYSPPEYSSPTAWQARLHLERSAAIKCPSILTHLAGSKKIQQVLATPASKHLEHFLKETIHDLHVDRVRDTFALMYPLDGSLVGQDAIALASNQVKSQKYVLKPQREGGGNNIYGIDIPPFLKSLGDDERKFKSYILMELIEPPALRNSIFRNGELKTGQVIGELGIFGVCLWTNPSAEEERTKVLENYEGGFLLRTKGHESHEGGVAAGFGSIDSPLLVESDYF